MGKLPLLFFEGFLAFASPCMLPMLPIYIMYLAAESENGKRAGVINTLGFVCGFTMIFVLLGASATTLGSLLNAHRFFLQRASGVVITLFGLHFLNIFNIGFLNAEHKIHINSDRRGFLGAILFGAAFSLGWTPCIGPFLGSALVMAGNSETIAEGMMMLFVFSMGLGIPYILAALFLTKLDGVFKWFERNARLIKVVSGVILIISGLLMTFDIFGYYEGLFF